MEEGRRMFQIFAARMFEQRVLQAYREKVARERQAKLMEEEEEELRKEEARREKKAKEALKRKEKAAQKKAALAEEKARKDAEKAEEEDAKRQEEARKAEEAKRKAEEKRKKKEAQRKAEEEERARKEAEKQRQKQLQAEQERKAKEAKEREKKSREEARLQKKEAREQKEREAKDEAEKRQRESEARTSKTDPKSSQKQQKQQEERAAKKAAALATPVTMSLPKRPAQHATNPALPVLPQQPPITSFASPKPAIATPALPKAPTPMKPRQISQQDGTSSAPGTAPVSGSASQTQSPNASTPAPQSPVLSGPTSHRGSVASHHSANMSSTISPLQSNTARFPPTSQSSQLNIPPVGMPFPPGLHHPLPPGFGNPMFAPAPPPGYRQPPPGMVPPGLSSPMLGRGYPAPVPPPGFAQPIPDPMAPFSAIGSKDVNPGTHSRQPSGGFESPSMHAAQPISRPTPIGRPASVVQAQRPHAGSPSAAVPKASGETEDHLGSSALLDDSEDVLSTLPEFGSAPRRGFAAPGRPPAFPPLPFGDPGILQQSQSPWGPSPIQPPGINHFAPAPGPPPGFWPVASPTPGFSAPIGIGRPSIPRQPASVVRQKLCNVCRDLAMQDPAADGFIPLNSVHEAIKDQIEFNPLGNGPLTDTDILTLCETEGTMMNGGGNFDVREDGSTKSIRWNPDKTPLPMGGFGAPGQIGSPIMGSSFGR